MESYDWRPITGGPGVTVSLGATAIRPGDSQSDVLARADRGLYAAKAAGRNQVRLEGVGAAGSLDGLGLAGPVEGLPA